MVCLPVAMLYTSTTGVLYQVDNKLQPVYFYIRIYSVLQLVL